MAAETRAKKARLDLSETFVNKDFVAAFSEDFDDCAKIPCRCLKFSICNASTRDSYTFSEAFCETSAFDDNFAFGTFFEDGILLLKKYVDDPVKMVQPQSTKKDYLLLHRLLDFLIDEKNKECLLEVLYDSADMSEGDLSATLANHLLSKLAINPTYSLANDYRKRSGCPCGCSEIICYGDTSFGSEKVWHGSADILVNESSVAIRSLEMTKDSPGRASVEVKRDFETAKKKIRNQLSAQTVCFSFLQGKRHPEFKNTLIPCIGISCSEVMIYMYDSIKDVFIQSCVLNMFDGDKRQLSTSTVIALWLAVNYKMLSAFNTSISDFIQTLPCANFFTVAKDKLHVYQKELKFGVYGSSPVSIKLFRREGQKQITHLKGSETMKSLGITKE